MGIRQNIFISIMIHAMIIASVFIVGGRIRDAAYRVPADPTVVSLLKEVTGITSVNSQGSDKNNTRRDKITSPKPALSQEIASTDFVSLAMTDEGSLKNSQTENTTLEDNKENNPPSPPFSKGGMGGLPKQNTSSQNTGKCQPEDKILESTKGGYHKGDTSPLYGLIRTAIEKAKSYPLLARKKKIEGTVLVSFTINKNGLPQGIQIIRSSGYHILDEEVLKIIKRAAPFPEVNHEIIAPITFTLKESISNR